MDCEDEDDAGGSDLGLKLEEFGVWGAWECFEVWEFREFESD